MRFGRNMYRSFPFVHFEINRLARFECSFGIGWDIIIQTTNVCFVTVYSSALKLLDGTEEGSHISSAGDDTGDMGLFGCFAPHIRKLCTKKKSCIKK